MFAIRESLSPGRAFFIQALATESTVPDAHEFTPIFGQTKQFARACRQYNTLIIQQNPPCPLAKRVFLEPSGWRFSGSFAERACLEPSSINLSRVLNCLHALIRPRQVAIPHRNTCIGDRDLRYVRSKWCHSCWRIAYARPRDGSRIRNHRTGRISSYPPTKNYRPLLDSHMAK